METCVAQMSRTKGLNASITCKANVDGICVELKTLNRMVPACTVLLAKQTCKI